MQIQEKLQQSEFKQKWFDFTKQLSSNQLSINLYKLFIIIEGIQFLAYHNNGLINYNTYIFNELGSFMQLINLFPLMLRQNVNIILVPIFSIIVFTHLILLFFGYKAYHRKIQLMNKSVLDRNFHKNTVDYFINLLVVSLSTFLTIPICQTSMTSIYCSTSSPFTSILNCNSTSQISLAILGSINIIWVLATNIYFALYYYSRNPFSTSFLTCSSNWWNLGKFAIKIIPTFYFSYDSQLAYPVLFLVMMNGCYAGYVVIFRIIFPYYRYNFDLEKFLFYLEVLILLINSHFIVIYAVSRGQPASKSYITLFWIIGSALIAKIWHNYFVYLKQQLIIEINCIEKTKLQSVQEYLIYLIYEVQKALRKQHGTFYLANIAKTHKQVCQNVNCYCLQYFKQIKSKKYCQNKQIFYTLLLAIIDRVLSVNKKAYQFFILKAYILYYKLHSQIKAATTIAMIMQDKLDFSDQMLVKGLLFELNHQYNDTRDMQVYRKFNEYLLQQQEESMRLVNYHLQYWEQLIDQNSSISKLHRILINIKQSKKHLDEIIQGALNIFRNHVRVLFLYKNFLKEVLNDYKGYLRYEEKYKVGLKEHKLSNVDAVNMIQFRPNQNLIVINFTRHYSTHSQILGNFKIISISSNVKDFLGFTNAQLKNQSLNKLIPRIYHSVHDNFIENVLDKRDSQIFARQIRIFPINSSGHIIECNIISKFMPSVTTGINIVSFLQQCDKQKDQFFIIYDKSNGMIDAMNQQAQRMLKDASRRKTNDMLVIPDHINDLVPHWDYKNEVWKDHIGRSKSFKSLQSLNNAKYEVRQIQIMRSDGLDNKFIKVLKFKGDFFVQMYSFENYQSYKQSNTIQQYLEYQKDNSYSKMDSNQLEDLISVETHKLIERDREKRKTIQKLQNQKLKSMTIQASPPKQVNNIFIILSLLLFVLALGFTIYQFILTSLNINTYITDSSLLINVNSVQFLLSDSTYIFSLVTTLMAYTSNMSLPYKNFQSGVQLLPQMQQMDIKYAELSNLIKIVNPIFIQKIKNGQLEQQTMKIKIKYLLNATSKQYYFQQTDILQAVLQYISYGEDLNYRILSLKQPIQIILALPNFFFIFANNIDILPNKILSIKNDILASINIQLNSGFSNFLIIKLLNSLMIFLSALAVIFFYSYIYRKYILRVLKMYTSIKIDQIKIYQQKCKKYKDSLIINKIQTLQKSEKIQQNIQQGFSNILKNQQIVDQRSLVSEAIIVDNQQEKLVKKQEDVQNEHFLSFEETPTLNKLFLMFICWFLIYGIILFAICFTYSNGTYLLENQIAKLNKYAILQNSVAQMRLFSQLSLNMLDYWDQPYLKTIEDQLEKYFQETVILMDDKMLNVSGVSAQFARKYEQLRYLQSLVIKNNFMVLNTLASQAQAQLEDIDYLVQYLIGQTNIYLPVVQANSQSIGNTMYICISIELIFIIVYWILAVRSDYLQLRRDHQSTFQMYNIISYNLRKQIEKK